MDGDEFLFEFPPTLKEVLHMPREIKPEPSPRPKRLTLRDLKPVLGSPEDRYLSEQIDAIVYGTDAPSPADD